MKELANLVLSISILFLACFVAARYGTWIGLGIGIAVSLTFGLYAAVHAHSAK